MNHRDIAKIMDCSAQAIEQQDKKIVRKLVKAAKEKQHLTWTEALMFVAEHILDIPYEDVYAILDEDTKQQIKEENS